MLLKAQPFDQRCSHILEIHLLLINQITFQQNTHTHTHSLSLSLSLSPHRSPLLSVSLLLPQPPTKFSTTKLNVLHTLSNFNGTTRSSYSCGGKQGCLQKPSSFFTGIARITTIYLLIGRTGNPINALFRTHSLSSCSG